MDTDALYTLPALFTWTNNGSHENKSTVKQILFLSLQVGKTTTKTHVVQISGFSQKIKHHKTKHQKKTQNTHTCHFL